MNKKYYKILLFLFIGIQLWSCKNDEQTNNEEIETLLPAKEFNADNAYNIIQNQVNFGPRIPGTPNQIKCSKYLLEELKKVCDTTYVQNTTVIANGKKLPCINMIGSINPNSNNRILLLSHWDTRPWADEEDANKTFDGADDGASGVGVLLELARLYKGQLKNIGIDILFVDVEDYGSSGESSSWCLGSSYWAQNPIPVGYKAKFGILLDMVGATNPTFYQDDLSKMYASQTLYEVWNIAAKMGYSQNFIMQNGMGLEDDHKPINEIANIPTIDIINTNGPHEFLKHHHTTKDNMQIISKPSLKIVGQVLSQLIAENEAKNSAI